MNYGGGSTVELRVGAIDACPLLSPRRCNDLACASAALTSIPNYLLVLAGADARILSAWGQLCSRVGQLVLSGDFGPPVQFNCTVR